MSSGWKSRGGPQATLYGRGALIGAVNVIQNKADLDAPYFEGTLGGGDDGYLRSVIVLNAPLGDTFAVRAAGTLRARDGYVENTLGGEDLGGVDVAAGRIAFAWEPSSTLRFDLIGNIHSDSNSGTAFKSGTYAPPGGDVSPYSPAALNTFGGFEGDRELGLQREVRSLTLLGNWQISPSLSLQSITGDRAFESSEVFDIDGSAMPLIVAAEDAQGDQFSQEFRLLWDNGGPVSGFVGASYFHEQGYQRAPTQYNEQYMLAFATGALPGPGIPDFAQIRASGVGLLSLILGSPVAANAAFDSLDTAHREFFTNYGETTSYDLFADATWHVTERFDLTGGVRYTTDDKESGLVAGFDTPSALGGLVAQYLRGQPAGDYGLFTQPGTASASDTFDAVTWRVNARYEFSENLAAWASYARGRRPEVIDISPGNLPGATASIDILPAELVDSVEVGTRGQDFFNGALDAEASVYYYQYTDFQTTEFNGLSRVTVNAGEASAYGFETALNWRPLDHFSVFGTYAYNHARFDEGAREGNSFRLSPDHSVSFGIDYQIPVGPGSIFFRPTYTWQSKIFFDDDNDRIGPEFQPSPLPPFLPPDTLVNEFQESYGLLNLRAGFENEDGHWAVEAFVTNALDEEYLMDAGNTGDAFTIPTFIRGTPRLVGMQVTAKF